MTIIQGYPDDEQIDSFFGENVALDRNLMVYTCTLANDAEMFVLSFSIIDQSSRVLVRFGTNAEFMSYNECTESIDAMLLPRL